MLLLWSFTLLLGPVSQRCFLHIQSWVSILRQFLMAPLGHAPFLDFSKKSLWKCSKVHFHTLIRLPHLLHRMDADNGVAGHYGWRETTLIWIPQWQQLNIPPPRCFISGGDSSAAHLSLPRAAAGNLMPENREHVLLPRSCQLPFTEQAVWYLHQRYTILFQQGCKPSLPPHLLGMSRQWKSFPSPPPSHPTLGCFSVSPALSTGPILWRSKNRVPGIGAKIQQHLWKR